MEELSLNLYGREGCCICDGLEQRLRAIPLQRLVPPVLLNVIDIDSPDFSAVLRSRYDLEVPVMALRSSDLELWIELPRVSPRLEEEGLFKWLQKAITKALRTD